MSIDAERGARQDDIKERNRIGGDRLRDGEQIKAKGASKGGWQTVERDEKPGSVRWTDVACHPLFPGETPMRSPRAGQDVLCGYGEGRRLRLGAAGQAHGFATDHFEPSSPNATA
jgi:hypothetical protein